MPDPRAMGSLSNQQVLLSSRGKHRMPRFRVELVSVDPIDDSHDIQFSTIVEASNEHDAVAAAKKVQSAERPELRKQDIWAWFPYETAEDQAEIDDGL